MDHEFCPGAKFMRQPKPEIFTCSACGGEVEIWSDEIRGVCAQCGRAMFRDGSMGCLEWCRHGKECVGAELYSRYQHNRAIGLRRKLLEAVAEYWGDDRRRLQRAEALAARAGEILRRVEADWHIVIPASILHDVATEPAPAGAGSPEAAVREILRRTGLCREDIEEIYRIAAEEPAPGQEQSANYRVVLELRSQHGGERCARESKRR
jgi:hypothetical protein